MFYLNGKDELMKVYLMKERDKSFMCLIQVIYDLQQKLQVRKQFHTVPDVTCKKAAFWNSVLSDQISMKKS